jgi:hypothetical protein
MGFEPTVFLNTFAFKTNALNQLSHTSFKENSFIDNLLKRMK